MGRGPSCSAARRMRVLCVFCLFVCVCARLCVRARLHRPPRGLCAGERIGRCACARARVSVFMRTGVRVCLCMCVCVRVRLWVCVCVR